MTNGSQSIYYSVNLKRQVVREYESGHFSKSELCEKYGILGSSTLLELIFTALGEEVTRQLAVKEDAQGFNENFDAASEGGRMAGKAIDMLESAKGLKVVSSDNFLGLKSNDAPDMLQSDK